MFAGIPTGFMFVPKGFKEIDVPQHVLVEDGCPEGHDTAQHKDEDIRAKLLHTYTSAAR